MANLARRGSDDISRVVSSLVPALETRDTLQQMDSWLRGHFHYRPEQEEVIRTVPFMLTNLKTSGFIEGDCDDIATFIGAWLKMMGIPARFTAIQSRPDTEGGEFDHVFAEGNGGGWWQPIDPTVPMATQYTYYRMFHETV